MQFQIEYERRGERAGDSESLSQIDFPDARQLGYYFAVRAGGRLEIEPGTMTQGWQRATGARFLSPSRSRQSQCTGLGSASDVTHDAAEPGVIRHSLADALKLRVASGILTTVLSPTGDQLTSVDVNMEVIQRSSLSVQLASRRRTVQYLRQWRKRSFDSTEEQQ